MISPPSPRSSITYIWHNDGLTSSFSPLCISNLYLAQRWNDRGLAGAGARVSWEFVVVVRLPASSGVDLVQFLLHQLQ